MEQVGQELAEIEDQVGPGAGYVFDDLTSMQRLWGPEAALALFLRCCRACTRSAPSPTGFSSASPRPGFRSRLADITRSSWTWTPPQANRPSGPCASSRPTGIPGVTGRTLRYVVGEDGRIDALQQTAGMREGIGAQVRAGRIAAGLSQAELARRIGVTPARCPRSSGAAMACRARP